MLIKNPGSIIFSFGLLILLLAANATATGDRQRIKFAKGENSASISGSVLRGETDNYLLGVREGQKMSVKISSDEKNAVFQIKDAASGKFLNGAGETDDATEWSNSMPNTGDYEIVVGGARDNAEYKLSVTVK